MRIYIIGMPAAGKSTVGKELAKKMHYRFIDLDSYIEQKNEAKVSKLFEEFGESGFRDLESEALEDMKSYENTVISCGGGIITRKENKEKMDGPVVLLNTSLDNLKLRISLDTKNNRPLSKIKSVEELYEERKSLYDYFKTFEVKSNILSKTVKDIMKGVKKDGKKKSISD